MLKKWGCEVGSHTMTHPSLAKLTDAQVKQELEKSKEWIKELGFEPKSLSLPMGLSPKNRALTHIYDSIVLVGSGPVRLEKLDPHRLPRIQAISGDFGIDYWLNKVEDGSVKPYVQP
jgi:peptidoglycan/xylan/chitin deacetylase (PgdA/CDA1 family)